MIFPRSIALLAALGLAGCAQYSSVPGNGGSVAKSLRQARSRNVPLEKRAALYVQTAAEAAPRLASGNEAGAARDTYNAAAAELTVLLRASDGARLWNRPLTLTTADATYRLRFQPGTKDGVWAPDHFDFFTMPRKVRENHLRVLVREAGLGGVLVGVHRPPDPEKVFLPEVGVAAPVTASLDFEGSAPGNNPVRNVVLSLHDPSRRNTIQIAGATHPLAADFTAPLAYYPRPRFLGLKKAMRVDRYFDSARLTMWQPYDPGRIPVVFVHGLVKTPEMWIDTIDAIESDPELRGRFQFWAFGYPTGNPIAISALQLRESLAGVYRLHPRTKDMVLVSHSLGGLLSKMQTVTTGRSTWDVTFSGDADRLYARVPADSLVRRALVFDANPRIGRVVFICVPHRGSPLAGGITGAIGVSLIRLPEHVADGVQRQIGNSLAVAGGKRGFVFPPSLHDLSDKSPLLHSLDTQPIRAPHHSIIGDRGRKNSPRSSDGVVPFSSSHLDSAQSELIVPGPHRSYALPQTIEEIRRILHLHLKTAVS